MKRFGNVAQARRPAGDTPEDGPTAEKRRKYGRARRLGAPLDSLRPVAMLAREVL